MSWQNENINKEYDWGQKGPHDQKNPHKRESIGSNLTKSLMDNDQSMGYLKLRMKNLKKSLYIHCQHGS